MAGTRDWMRRELLPERTSLPTVMATTLVLGKNGLMLVESQERAVLGSVMEGTDASGMPTTNSIWESEKDLRIWGLES